MDGLVSLSVPGGSRSGRAPTGPICSLMDTKDDAEVVRVATAALIRRMTDDQINRVIGELEYIAEERGDRTGEPAHAQAALHLIGALESRRERRVGQSVPPPSLDASSNGQEA
jgi:hypothetical protein